MINAIKKEVQGSVKAEERGLKKWFLLKSHCEKLRFHIKIHRVELYASFFRGCVVNGCASDIRIPMRDLKATG